MWLNKELIVEVLRELTDIQLQQKLWLSDGTGDASSLVEAIEQLYTDSGLGDAIEAQKSGYSPAVEGQFSDLLNVLLSIPRGCPPSDTIADPRMSEVRRLAGALLKTIDG